MKKSVPLIVGVGASAGGLEAFQDLLRALDNVDDLSIVFVQHLEKDGGDLLLEPSVQVHFDASGQGESTWTHGTHGIQHCDADTDWIAADEAIRRGIRQNPCCDVAAIWEHALHG
ncbi:MAG: hypothetical protein KDB22_07320 [Planctomycetales bacterium]|nr:hypothetical protein [Planctomycetales bacterium]